MDFGALADYFRNAGYSFPYRLNAQFCAIGDLIQIICEAPPRRHWYTLKCIYRMRFDWDEGKNRINRAKHGIDFAFARLAFDDPFAITIQDRDVDGEQRYQLIGAVYSRVILVAHAVATEGLGEDEEAIRIISARKATRLERKRYEENYPTCAAN